MSTAEDGIYIIKIHRDSGQEAIYSLKEGEGGAFRAENSTYNYGSQSNAIDSTGDRPHKAYDMTTHNKWLESEEAYEKSKSSEEKVDELAAIKTAGGASLVADFTKKWDAANIQLSYAKLGLIQDGTKTIEFVDEHGNKTEMTLSNYVLYTPDE